MQTNRLFRGMIPRVVYNNDGGGGGADVTLEQTQAQLRIAREEAKESRLARQAEVEIRKAEVAAREATEIKWKSAEDARKVAEEAIKAAENKYADEAKAWETRTNEAVEVERKARRDDKIDADLRVAAVQAGIVDIDGLKLVDRTALKINDKGQVEGVAELIEATKKAKPYLFHATGPTGTSNPKDAPGAGPNGTKLAKDMTEAERAAFLADNQKKFGR
jgi:hypothetical protein